MNGISPLPLPSGLPLVGLPTMRRFIRLVMQNVVHAYHDTHGTWPSTTTLLAYMRDELGQFFELDSYPYPEGVRWLSHGQYDDEAPDDYGIVILEQPEKFCEVVVPHKLANEVEQWLREQ